MKRPCDDLSVWVLAVMLILAALWLAWAKDIYERQRIREETWKAIQQERAK